jgi:hypothetical protein
VQRGLGVQRALEGLRWRLEDFVREQAVDSPRGETAVLIELLWDFSVEQFNHLCASVDHNNPSNNKKIYGRIFETLWQQRVVF